MWELFWGPGVGSIARATPRFSQTRTSPRTPCVRGNCRWAPCRILGSPQCLPTPLMLSTPTSGHSYPLPDPSPSHSSPPARTGRWMPLPAHPAITHTHTHTPKYLYLQEHPGQRRRREEQEQKQVTCSTEPSPSRMPGALDHGGTTNTFGPLGWAGALPGESKPMNLRDPSCLGLETAV